MITIVSYAERVEMIVVIAMRPFVSGISDN